MLRWQQVARVGGPYVLAWLLAGLDVENGACVWPFAKAPSLSYGNYISFGKCDARAAGVSGKGLVGFMKHVVSSSAISDPQQPRGRPR